MWANAEKLLSVFTLIRSCSGMERMRASLKKSSFVLTAAIRRQAWRAERRGIQPFHGLAAHESHFFEAHLQRAAYAHAFHVGQLFIF